MDEQSPEAIADVGARYVLDAHRGDQARHLIAEFGHIQANVRQARLNRARALLSDPVIRDDLTRRRLRRQLTAERFNVFDALRLERREIYHSRFLAYLLDPRQTHDQSALFLKALVGSIIRQLPVETSAHWDTTLHYESCQVAVEKKAKAAGLIDLVLEFRCGTRIAIENKVDHVEGDRQLPRYRAWLNERGGDLSRQVLVFLTPDGRESVDECGEYVRLSYHDLADALAAGRDECPSTALPLLACLQQYIQLCRRLADGGHEMLNQSAEILDFLRNPEKLEIALDISDHVKELEKEIQEQFRDRVIERLQELLRKDSTSGLWVAGRGWPTYICIKTARHGPNGANANYSCGIYLQFSGNVHGGWHRPKNISLNERPADCDTLEVEETLKSANLGMPGDWWVGCAYLSSADIPYVTSWELDDKLAICRDNRGEGGLELAARVANWIWVRFVKCRDEIEKLESFKAEIMSA